MPGWNGKCCHGDNEEEIHHQLCLILEEWIEIRDKDNIPLPSHIAEGEFSGEFQLQIDRNLQKALAIHAMQANERLKRLCDNI